MTESHIPESEKRQKEPEMGVSVDKIRSAFVIKKGAYEKLVCAKCAPQNQEYFIASKVFPGQSLDFTPVTLSCEAHCSICDEAI